MAITKEIVDDKLEVVGNYKHIQVRTATIINEDGIELSRSFNRRVITQFMDVNYESDEIQRIAAAVWTDDVKAAWQTLQDNR